VVLCTHPANFQIGVTDASARGVYSLRKFDTVLISPESIMGPSQGLYIIHMVKSQLRLEFHELCGKHLVESSNIPIDDGQYTQVLTARLGSCSRELGKTLSTGSRQDKWV
jgi:hypothetical protein